MLAVSEFLLLFAQSTYKNINLEKKLPAPSGFSKDPAVSAPNINFIYHIRMAGEDWGQTGAHAVTQSFPSPGISFLQPPPGGPEILRISAANALDGPSNPSSHEPATSKHLKDIHMSARLMEEFLDLASDNTNKNLETCGVLGAFLEEGTFYVTNLIIPKQESTSNSCQAVNEEEIYEIQNAGSLFPIGWIHTHPSQSCFMSSVDLHTQYTYQMMVPEAVGIVMAPTDNSRNYGIFRLSDPDGMNILKECQEKGFHSHVEPENGSPIYLNCFNIIFNPNLRLEICDLR